MQSQWWHAGSPSRDAIGLSGILLVAATIRIIAWHQTAVIFNDGPIFLALAEAIGEGDWSPVLAHPYHPLYPALIRLVAFGPLGFEVAGVAVSIFGGLLAVGAIFVFTRFAFDREIAWLSAWVVALHPWAVDFSADVMSDGLYAGFYLVGFAAMARALMRPSLASAVVCGLVTGLAFLVRPEGIGLLFIAILLFAARAIAQPVLRQRIATAGLVLVLVGTAVVSPFVLQAEGETGELALTQKKSITELVLGPEDEGEDEEAVTVRAGAGRLAATTQLEALAEPKDPLPMPESAIRSDGRGERLPSHDLVGSIEAVGRMLSTSLAAIRYEVAAFAVLGLWVTRSRRDPWREATIGLPILFYSGLLVILVWGAGYVSRRHALAAWLPAVGFAALGWRFVWKRLVDRARARGLSTWAGLATPRMTALFLVLTLCLVWGARDLRPRREDRAPVRLAGEWLAQNRAETGPVAAQKLRTAYYADAAFVPLPPGHDGRLEHDLRRRGARWVVIDGAKLGDHIGLEAGIGDWLRLVHEIPAEPAPVLILAVEPIPAR